MPAEKILIVEDEPSVAGFMKSALERLGYSIPHAVLTGKEAIRTAEQCKPDLVLMDIHLRGGMDGVEAAEQIRFGSDIPVIFVTGDREDRLLERSKSAEPIGFVLKPFSIRELQNTIEIGLENYRSARKRNREECKQAEAELRESEQRYRSLAEAAQDQIFIVNLDGCFLYVNGAVARALGRPSAQIIGQKLAALFPPETLHAQQAMISRVIENGAPVNEVIHLDFPDGPHWHDVSLVPLKDAAGHLTSVMGIARDITGRRLTEEALRESEKRYESLLETTNTGFVSLDLEGRVVDANPEYLRLSGHRSLCEILGRSVTDWTAQHDISRNAEEIRKCLERGFVRNLEIDYVDKEGTLTFIEINATVVQTAQGKNILMLCRDISERKRSLEALQKSEERYRSLFENMAEGCAYCRMLFEDGRPQDFIYLAVNQSFETQTGLKDVVGRKASEVIPGIRETDPELFERYGRVASTGHPERFEFYVGALKMWFAISVYSPAKEHFIAIFDVITERKQAEKTLAQSNAILSAVNEGASNLICVKDREGRVLMANPAMLNFLGKSESEIVGKTDLDFVADAAQRRLIMENDRRVMASGRSETVEETGTSPRGPWTMLFTKFPHRNPQGEIIGIIGVGTDITERKQIEEERLRSLTRQVLLNQVQQDLLGTGELEPKLKLVTDRIVDIFEADFCRIWLTGPGDLCEHGCMHATIAQGRNACRDKDKCLRLVASSGRYTHTNGLAHQRIPFGAHKIGRVASGEETLLFTNDIASDPGIEDQDWAGRLGLSSFASFQLRSSDADCIGVLALFSKHAIAPEEHAQLGALSGAVAHVIVRAQTAEALRQQTERFGLIAETIDEVFWISDVFEEKMLYISPAFDRIWGYSRQKMYENRAAFRKALHPEDFERIMESLRIQKTGQPYDHEYRIIRPDGSVRQIWDRGYPVKDESGTARIYVGVAQDVTARRTAENALQKSTEYLNQIINCIGDPVFVKDRQHRFVLTNDAGCILIGLKREEIIGNVLEDTLPQGVASLVFEQEERVFQTGKPDITIEDLQVLDGRRFTVMSHKTLLTAADGSQQVVGVIRDITELKKAERERAILEIQLRQAQKLEAIGQLAAGIAHEINTPTQYVSDNTRFLQAGYSDVLKVLESYHHLLHANRQGKVDPALIAEVEAALAKADLDYLMAETPKALAQSLEGLGRVATIVRAMKEFSHPGGEGKQTIDLNHAIQNTVTVCRSEWKYVAEMVLDLDPALPLVPCLPGDFNQVILNIVVNAAHAIADTIHCDEKQKGTIRIATRHDRDWVEIRIGDTGTGIPEKHWDKIFTPFFTTKEVGKGTGQGLAISHSVIVKKHGGTIRFETADGKGTTFIIRLPLGSESIQ